jgi:hypothetical protein
VDVSDGRIDDGRFGGTADLREVREELGEVLSSEVIKDYDDRGDRRRTKNRPLRVSLLCLSTAL